MFHLMNLFGFGSVVPDKKGSRSVVQDKKGVRSMVQDKKGGILNGWTSARVL